jgi:hypothetical protein
MFRPKIFVVAVVVLLGLCLPALAQDVAGWGKTTWGMSRDEVKGLYADRIDRVRDDGVIELKPVDMEGIPVVIRFVFREEGNLSRVVLSRTPSVRMDNLFYIESFKTLRTLLVQKYGEPDVEMDDSAQTGYLKMETLWFRGRTQIALVAFEAMLFIEYTPAKKLDDL